MPTNPLEQSNGDVIANSSERTRADASPSQCPAGDTAATAIEQIDCQPNLRLNFSWPWRANHKQSDDIGT
jgi:hypothetical protein